MLVALLNAGLGGHVTVDVHGLSKFTDAVNAVSAVGVALPAPAPPTSRAPDGGNLSDLIAWRRRLRAHVEHSPFDRLHEAMGRVVSLVQIVPEDDLKEGVARIDRMGRGLSFLGTWREYLVGEGVTFPSHNLERVADVRSNAEAMGMQMLAAKSVTRMEATSLAMQWTEVISAERLSQLFAIDTEFERRLEALDRASK